MGNTTSQSAAKAQQAVKDLLDNNSRLANAKADLESIRKLRGYLHRLAELNKQIAVASFCYGCLVGTVGTLAAFVVWKLL